MFLKKEKADVLKEAPLGYWEEKSYMLVIPKDDNEDLITPIFERISTIENIEIKEKRYLTENEPGSIKLIYENEEYELGFYPSNFSLPQSYIKGPYHFSTEEIENLTNERKALTIFMEFKKDSKKSFHLQLKIAVAIVPNLIGIMDESAEKMLPAKWAIMAANSKILPSANDLYTIQAVSDKNGEVWLHTHGLCRCGLTELEILDSDVKNYKNHYNLISTFASYLLDKNYEFNINENSTYIGMLLNRQPVVVTCVSWTKGLKEYNGNLTVGNVEDRKDGHNSRTSLIFIYKSENDEKNQKYSKVSEYNNLWGENPILFISKEETERMKELAKERFVFVKEESKKKDNKISIKIALKTDNDDFEHIWFELIEFCGEKFKAKLLQEPYNVENMHEGDENWYTVEEVTDWVIYTPNFTVTPGKAYLLEK